MDCKNQLNKGEEKLNAANVGPKCNMSIFCIRYGCFEASHFASAEDNVFAWKSRLCNQAVQPFNCARIGLYHSKNSIFHNACVRCDERLLSFSARILLVGWYQS